MLSNVLDWFAAHPEFTLSAGVVAWNAVSALVRRNKDESERADRTRRR